MTFRPHPMTRHDTLSAYEYAEEVMRAELQGGMSILPKHFHILAGLVRSEKEKRDVDARAARGLSQASSRVDGEDRAGGR
jgi:hypothetical protein